MITLTTKSPVRHIEDDMTAEELALLNRPLESWGDAQAAAERGAVYLDRVLPGWADRVEIKHLDLSDVCHCVLGQIFQTESKPLKDEAYRLIDDDEEFELMAAGNGKIDSDAVNSGFDLALELWGLSKLEAERVSKPGFLGARKAANAAHFFGFDHTVNYSYWDLTTAWQPLIEARQSVKA